MDETREGWEVAWEEREPGPKPESSRDPWAYQLYMYMARQKEFRAGFEAAETKWHPYPKVEPEMDSSKSLKLVTIHDVDDGDYYVQTHVWYGRANGGFARDNEDIVAWADLPAPFALKGGDSPE